jgi:hypothetical protein
MNNIHDLNRAFFSILKYTIVKKKENAILLFNLTSAQCDAIMDLSFSEVECLAKTDKLLFQLKLTPDDMKRLLEEETSKGRVAISILAGEKV